MSTLHTKAQELGVKPKVLVAKTNRTVAKAKALLETIAYAWCEVDGGVSYDVEQIIERLDQLPAAMDEACFGLAQPWGGAE